MTSQLNKIYSKTFKTFRENPVVLLPFLIFACLEFVVLIIAYVIPRQPIVVMLGPIVKTLWGEQFLHYPGNFLLIPKLMYLSRMVLAVVFGSFLTGVAVSMLYSKRVEGVFKKYFALLLVVLVNVALFYTFNKLLTFTLVKYFMAGHAKLLFLKPGIWFGPLLPVIGFFIALVIQTLLIYAIPAIIRGEEKFLKAIARSFVFFKNNFLLTLVLVGGPMLLYVPLIVLGYNTTFLMYALFPEIVLILSVVNIVVASLIIDSLVTVSTALFYLEKNK